MFAAVCACSSCRFKRAGALKSAVWNCPEVFTTVWYFILRLSRSRNHPLERAHVFLSSVLRGADSSAAVHRTAERCCTDAAAASVFPNVSTLLSNAALRCGCRGQHDSRISCRIVKLCICLMGSLQNINECEGNSERLTLQVSSLKFDLLCVIICALNDKFKHIYAQFRLQLVWWMSWCQFAL